MKRKVSILLLSLIFVCLLCACGGGSKRFSIVDSEWTSIFNSDFTISFSKNGKGIYGTEESTWEETKDGSIKITCKVQGFYGEESTIVSDYTLVEVDGIYELVGDNNCFILSDSYKENIDSIRQKLVDTAEPLDRDELKKEINANESRAKAKYDNQVFTYTTIVREISTSYVTASDKLYNGLPLDGFKIYMGTDDLIQLDVGDTITVCGYVSVVSAHFAPDFTRAFLVK